jgi:hypothetical protein
LVDGVDVATGAALGAKLDAEGFDVQLDDGFDDEDDDDLELQEDEDDLELLELLPPKLFASARLAIKASVIRTDLVNFMYFSMLVL